jgi:dihydrofolate reductase/thymidylate synthase
MIELIIAMDENGGIGYQGRLPWHIKEELKLFKEKTIGRTLVMGRKTVETLPSLPGREIICVSRHPELYNNTDWKNNPIAVVSQIYSLADIYENPMIAGGAEIYRMSFEVHNFIQKVHLSVMKGTYECDTYFNKDWLNDFVIEEMTEYDEFTHYTMIHTSFGERQYLDLLQNIMTRGSVRMGRNGNTMSIFKNDMSFDLRNGFPLLTTKKMFLRGILEELLFFMRGNTDSKILEEKNVNIWRGNSDRKFLDSLGMTERREGVLGPCYGYQWRYFNAMYDEKEAKPLEKGVDQLANIIEMIRNDPYSRRIMLTAFNPAQIDQCVLPPCHSVFVQFYVQDDFLDMYAVNRSSDVFLGLPFNIASYAMFLSIIAKITQKQPRHLHITLGDTHIYANHEKQVQEQLKRLPFKFPTLTIPEIHSLDDIPNLKTEDFSVQNYQSHSSIKAKMVA